VQLYVKDREFGNKSNAGSLVGMREFDRLACGFIAEIAGPRVERQRSGASMSSL
jgi:hypothetical protein